MMKFSERFGYVKPRTVVQLNGMDQALRTRIWNVLCVFWFEYLRNYDDEVYGVEVKEHALLLGKRMWNTFWRKPIDEFPVSPRLLFVEIKDWFNTCEWYEVYDLLEFFAENHPNKEALGDACRLLNRELEGELSGFRLVGGRIASMTSPEEISEVEAALALADRFSLVAEHLAKALALLSDRKTPDYRNSVKESISAVEAACSILVGEKTTLGQALKMLKIPDHGAFRAGMSKLYGYTNDADGIRHALHEKSEIDQADARYFLVICSAFVNYVIARSTKEG